MSEYSALEHWLTENAVVVFLMISLLFAGLVKMSLMVWDQHKQLEKSEIAQLVIQIQNLVEQIKFLFEHQDDHNGQIDVLKGRVGNLEKKVGQQLTRCGEREKMLLEIKEKQEKNMVKCEHMHRRD